MFRNLCENIVILKKGPCSIKIVQMFPNGCWEHILDESTLSWNKLQKDDFCLFKFLYNAWVLFFVSHTDYKDILISRHFCSTISIVLLKLKVRQVFYFPIYYFEGELKPHLGVDDLFHGSNIYELFIWHFIPWKYWLYFQLENENLDVS